MNKRDVMIRAWEIRKSENLNMSISLKRAWAEAKDTKSDYVKCETLLVLQETEKAYRVTPLEGCDHIQWVPKSQVVAETKEIEYMSCLCTKTLVTAAKVWILNKKGYEAA